MNFYRKRYANLKKAIKTLHWNETDGVWYDYDLERKVKFILFKKFCFYTL